MKQDNSKPCGDRAPKPFVAPEGTEGERSEPEGAVGATNGLAPTPTNTAPDPEVPATARRRTFTAQYKLGILREADACNKPGELGALLRREGLYSSLLTQWRRQREHGAFEGLAPKKRGRKSNPSGHLKQENARLERELKRLRRELENAELIIDVQKKVSEVLGIRLRTPEDEDNNS